MTVTEAELFEGYAGRTAQAHMTETVLLERIHELVLFRRWYRQQANWSWWSDLAERNDIELRGLLRVARVARRLAAEPATSVWTEAELREAYGR